MFGNCRGSQCLAIAEDPNVWKTAKPALATVPNATPLPPSTSCGSYHVSCTGASCLRTSPSTTPARALTMSAAASPGVLLEGRATHAAISVIVLLGPHGHVVGCQTPLGPAHRRCPHGRLPPLPTAVHECRLRSVLVWRS
jgi:hypothetical protein